MTQGTTDTPVIVVLEECWQILFSSKTLRAGWGAWELYNCTSIIVQS